MKRVLFLGNSHLAALRQAHLAGPGRWPGLDARFLGAHKDLLLQTTVTPERIAPATPVARDAFARLNNADGAVLGDLDLIVIAGCLISVQVAVRLWRVARWPGLPSLDRAPDLAALPLISGPAAAASLTAAIDSRLGLRLVRHLRRAVATPILLVAQPAPSDVVRGRSVPSTHSLVLAERLGDGQALARLFDQAAGAALARQGAGYLPQPQDTRASALTTDPAYMEGAVRLSRRPGLPQPPEDVSHANAAFGALILDQVARMA
jgi:hypothetical protein